MKTQSYFDFLINTSLIILRSRLLIRALLGAVFTTLLLIITVKVASFPYLGAQTTVKNADWMRLPLRIIIEIPFAERRCFLANT